MIRISHFYHQIHPPSSRSLTKTSTDIKSDFFSLWQASGCASILAREAVQKLGSRTSWFSNFNRCDFQLPESLRWSTSLTSMYYYSGGQKMSVPALSQKIWIGEVRNLKSPGRHNELSWERSEVKSGRATSRKRAVRYLEGCCWSHAIKVRLDPICVSWYLYSSAQSQVSFSCLYSPLEFIPRTTSFFCWHCLYLSRPPFFASMNTWSDMLKGATGA